MIAQKASWRLMVAFSCLFCLQAVSTSDVRGQEAAGRQGSYFLGTATTGGTYHPVGVALSTLVKLKLLPDHDVDLTAINTDGSAQNIELLGRDEIQFAIISALAGYDARTGTGDFVGAAPDDELRAITTLWLSTDHLVVRGDSVESGTVDDFIGLRGRPVSLGREESGTLLENRRMLAALGVNADRDFELVELGYGESAEALAEGSIDGMSVSGGVPIAAVQDVFDALGDDAAVLEINDEQLARIDQGRGLWQRVVIPSGTYPQQDREIFTIGTPNILAVRADVDEEVVYLITKTIFEELEYLHGLHGATSQISLDNAVNDLPLPIHEGAVRYFEEKGVELPPPPVRLDTDLLARYDSVEQARAAANRGLVTLFAGTEGDTVTRVAAELASVLDPEADGVRLIANNGGGIGRNLTDLLYLRGVDAALVRADVLNYARNHDVYPTVENQVNYISEMFPEEVHLLVREEIGGIADLAGKTINVGVEGSGSEITASIILSQLGIAAGLARFDAHMAIEKLQRGEIDGAFFVGGKPMPLLQQIPAGSGLKLLSLPDVQYFNSYRPAEIDPGDYPGLASSGEPVSTMAVRTILLTYAWRPDSNRYAALETLTGSVFEHLLQLQSDGYHPKWREVDPAATFEGWRRFQPSIVWLDDNQGTARRIVSEGRQRLQRQTEAADTGPEPAEDPGPEPSEAALEPVRPPNGSALPVVPARPTAETPPVELGLDADDGEPSAAANDAGAARPPSVSFYNDLPGRGGPTSSPGTPAVPTVGSNRPTF